MGPSDAEACAEPIMLRDKVNVLQKNKLISKIQIEPMKALI